MNCSSALLHCLDRLIGWTDFSVAAACGQADIPTKLGQWKESHLRSDPSITDLYHLSRKKPWFTNGSSEERNVIGCSVDPIPSFVICWFRYGDGAMLTFCTANLTVGSLPSYPYTLFLIRNRKKYIRSWSIMFSAIKESMYSVHPAIFSYTRLWETSGVRGGKHHIEATSEATAGLKIAWRNMKHETAMEYIANKVWTCTFILLFPYMYLSIWEKKNLVSS